MSIGPTISVFSGLNVYWQGYISSLLAVANPYRPVVYCVELHGNIAEFALDNYFVIVSIQHRDDSFRHYSLSWYKLIRYTDG